MSRKDHLGGRVVDRHFGPEARARVEAAVREAEARSLGQIVPVVVARSAGYPEARYRGALVAAALAAAGALAADHWLWPVALWELALLEVVAGVAGALLALWDPIERLLAGRAERALATEERARFAFRVHRLDRTERGTGVLVFASLFERRAVILGDHGIDAKMGAAEWQRAVDRLAAGMRRGDAAAGFCEAIALVGGRLAEAFPRGDGPGPGNELPDALRAGSGLDAPSRGGR